MSDSQTKQTPAARTGMLIRKPVAEVFAAFVDPRVTTRFWFTRSSGPLEVGRSVTWEWEMYGVSTQVLPKVVDANRRIVIEWDGYTGRTTVEWKFVSMEANTTFVSIAESGWTSTGDALLAHTNSSTEGFTWTLAGLKALLEHGIELNVVADRFPRGPGDPYPEH